MAGMSGEHGQTLSSSRVRQAHRLLATLMDAAVEDGRLSRNPAHSPGGKDGFLPRGAKQKAHRYLSHDEVGRLVEATPEHYRPLIYLLAYTGLRWGEATALRVGDVDMLRRRVQVSRSVAEVSGTLIYGTTKTHASRSVPFPEFVGRDMSLRMDGRPREALLFTTPTGAPIRLANFRRRVFDPAVRAAGLIRLTPHDLRHTAASLAVSAGATVKGVQGMLGHQDASLTLNTYAGLFDGDLDDVAERLGAAAAHYLPTGRTASDSSVMPLRAADAV